MGERYFFISDIQFSTTVNGVTLVSSVLVTNRNCCPLCRETGARDSPNAARITTPLFGIDSGGGGQVYICCCVSSIGSIFRLSPQSRHRQARDC